MPVKKVRDPIRKDARRRAGRRVRREAVLVEIHQVFVVVHHLPAVHGGGGAPEVFDAEAGRRQGFVYRLEEQSVLWVRDFRLVVLDVEKVCVERANVLIEKIRVCRIGPAVERAVWVVEGVDVKPLGGHLLEEAPGLLEDFP